MGRTYLYKGLHEKYIQSSLKSICNCPCFWGTVWFKLKEAAMLSFPLFVLTERVLCTSLLLLVQWLSWKGGCLCPAAQHRHKNAEPHSATKHTAHSKPAQNCSGHKQMGSQLLPFEAREKNLWQAFKWCNLLLPFFSEVSPDHCSGWC